MTGESQLMFVPIYAIGGWSLKILWDMNTGMGNIQADVNNKFGDIKADLAEIKLEIAAIKTRLDKLETPGVIARP